MLITVNILVWNRLEETKMLISRVWEDIEPDTNNTYHVMVVDNGSDRETQEYLQEAYRQGLIHSLCRFTENVGISKAKNKMIENSVDLKSEYFFMFDNDVVPIKGSFVKMIDYMEKNLNVGCFGQNIDLYKKDINDRFIPEVFPNIDVLGILVDRKSGSGAVRAWTHYSIYRNSLFDQGVKFDDTGPFGHAGYGFDDDDLGMQIHMLGYEIHCFDGVFCFHNVNSSVDELKESGKLNYNERKEYFNSKWAYNVS